MQSLAVNRSRLAAVSLVSALAIYAVPAMADEASQYAGVGNEPLLEEVVVTGSPVRRAGRGKCVRSVLLASGSIEGGPASD